MWDARKLDDRSYHRRRLLFAILLGVIGLGLLVSRVQHIAYAHANAWDFLSAAVWLGMMLYAAPMGIREVRAMHQSVRR